jgi:hypothetical protein
MEVLLMKTWIRLALASILALGAGCGKSDMPPTYPVTGTVTFRDGEPIRGGLVVFRSLAEDGVSVSGVVGEEGSFALQTLKGKEKAAGAPEGSYRVSFMPPQGEDQRAMMPPVELPLPHQVEPKENHFDLKVDRPAARQGPVTPGAP